MKSPTIISAWSSHPAVNRWLIGVVLALALPVFCPAQNKQDLEEKRKKLIREIEVTDNLLHKTTRNKAATLDRYVTLQKQIERREKLIETLGEEIAESEAAAGRTVVVVESLTRDIQTMQQDYGRIVRNAYRRKEMSNPLLYVLSADNLNQAFRRWLFLRKYDRYRKTQAEAIVATQQTLSKKIAALDASRREQETLLASLQGQRTALSTEMQDKEKLLEALKKDEGRLRDELKQKQAAHEALNQAIERVIQEEIRKKMLESRRAAAPTPAPSANPTATPPATTPAASASNAAVEEAAVSESTAELKEDATSLAFRQSRGRLPWPVEKGFVARGFGRQKHPTLRNIEITNNGVDIRTDENSAVRSVYAGVVAGVQFIPGHDYTVILQHGNYYTVYSNLSETKLNKGDRVTANQTIGRVSTNPITGASELHFELWHQKERMNPAGWIKK
ncbi:MAG: peptidoglycan DD-metalloendopeptidase family protein [Saprospiraceae bacterium]|nr:peptidoglycan DD-metalloendopeptidase family protein [Saprospiraceae bacterium]